MRHLYRSSLIALAAAGLILGILFNWPPDAGAQNPPDVTLSLSRDSIREDYANFYTSAVTAGISPAASQTTTFSVVATPVSPATTTDYILSASTTLVIPAGATSSVGIVTIAPVDDNISSADKTILISLTHVAGPAVTLPPAKPFTIIEVDLKPPLLTLSAASIPENGGTATVTAALVYPTRSQTVMTVVAYPFRPATSSDVTLSGSATLTFPAMSTSTTSTVTITAVDNQDVTGDKKFSISLVYESGPAALPPAKGKILTVTDDNSLSVALELSPPSIPENGGPVAVTATQNRTSTAATTITVAARPATPTNAALFTLSASTTLTIPVGATASTGTVAITPRGNGPGWYAPDRMVIVFGEASNAAQPSAPPRVTDAQLTITDADAPVVTLWLSPSTIPENGTTTIRASQNFVASVGTRVTAVLVNPVSPATTTDFTLYTARNLIIPRMATHSTGTVTITANNNTATSSSKTLNISANISNGAQTDPAPTVTGAALTIVDDDSPMVALSLSTDSISENGGAATITATQNRTSTATTTIAVSATPHSPAAAADFTLSTTTLTIPPGAAGSTATVTIAAVNNDVFSLDKRINLSATATNGNALPVAGAVLTIIDDEPDCLADGALVDANAVWQGMIDDCQILLTLKDTLRGETELNWDSSLDIRQWTGVDVSQGFGEGCDPPNGVLHRVVGITFQQQRYTPIANDFQSSNFQPKLTGTIPAGLADLTALRGIVVSHQAITGDIPKELANLPCLRRLGLHNNKGANSGVTGSIPKELGYLPNFTSSISLGNNRMTGKIPKELGRLNRLQGFDIENNDFTGPIPPELGNMSTITGFLVSGNSLTGSIPPELGQLTSVTRLHLHYNCLTGSIPPELGYMSSLEQMQLVPYPTSDAVANCTPLGITDPRLTGEIPPELGKLYNLTLLQLQRNNLTGGIPPEFGNLPKLNWMILFGNGLSGNIPAEIGGLSNLVYLYLDSNQLDGNIPAALGNLSNLRFLYLNGNRLDGNIPAALGDLSNLQRLYLNDNQLEGTIPAQLADLSNLQRLYLNDNQLDGTIPIELSRLTRLRELGLANNNLHSEITLSLDPAALTESDGETAFTVTASIDPGTIWADGLTSSTSTLIAENITLSATGSAITNAVGFTARVTSFNIPRSAVTTDGDGVMSASVTSSALIITPAGNSVYNRPETITVAVAGGVGLPGFAETALRGKGAAPTIALSDDDRPAVTLAVAPPSIPENGGQAVITATQDFTAAATTTITVAAAPVSPAAAADFRISTSTTLIIPPGQTASTGTVAITANDDFIETPDKSINLSGAARNPEHPGGVDVNGAVLTIAEDDIAAIDFLPRESPGVTASLSLAPSTLTEGGSPASTMVTASLSASLNATTTITVSVTPQSPATAAHYRMSDNVTLTIPALQTTSTGVVAISSVNDDRYIADRQDGAKLFAVDGSASDGLSVTGAQLRIYEDDSASPPPPTEPPPTNRPNPIVIRPQVTLSLSPASIDENGGVATVTAKQSQTDAGDTEVTISVAPISPANAGDYALSAKTTLTIPAGQRSSTGTVTITAVDNDNLEADKQFSVNATAQNDKYAGNLSATGATLTITDDDAPEVTLTLSDSAISENGGAATVTATQDVTDSADTVVTISVTPTSPATASDYRLSANTTLTIPAGQRSSAGTVTITALDNNAIESDKRLSVGGTAANTNHAGGLAVTGAALTIADDDTPRVTLTLSDSSIAENGGTTTVTATQDRPDDADTRVTISVTSTSLATADDYRLSANVTLTIPAGQRTSTGTVTITAVDNDDVAADKRLSITGTAANTNYAGGLPVTGAALTIADDDSPRVTLMLSDSSIAENGGVATVTATQDRADDADTRVTISVTPASPATADDYRLSANVTLTIPAGQLSSTGTVTITAVDNNAIAPDKRLSVRGTAANTNYAGGLPVTGAALTIADDDTPRVTLTLSDSSIAENGGAATVTATQDKPDDADTRITVSVTPVSPATANDYQLSTNTTLTIPAGLLSSTGTVTITAIDNNAIAPDKRLSIAGTATNTNYARSLPVTEAALTIADDDTPAVTLSLSASSINENGGAATVTATQDRADDADTQVTISVTSTSPATADDYRLSANVTLTIPAGQRTSTGIVTITAIDNNAIAPDKHLSVRGTASNTNYARSLPVTGAALTIADDDTPRITLTLSNSSITENGGTTTVTATQDNLDDADTRITVSVTPSSPATANDYRLSANVTLTIPAGQLSSTGIVTITAVDNDAIEADKRLSVGGTASNTNHAGGLDVTGAALTIANDDAPAVTLSLSASRIAENGGVASVTAAQTGVASSDTTVTLSVSPSSGYILSGKTLTIPAGRTAGAGRVTITAIDDRVDAPDIRLRISGTAANPAYGGGLTVTGAALTIADDDTPAVTLLLSPQSIAENGGAASLTASQSVVSTRTTTIALTAAAVSPASAADYTLSGRALTIPAGRTGSSDMVTITANDNAVAAPDKRVRLTGAASNGNAPGGLPVTGATLRITDNDPPPAPPPTPGPTTGTGGPGTGGSPLPTVAPPGPGTGVIPLPAVTPTPGPGLGGIPLPAVTPAPQPTAVAAPVTGGNVPPGATPTPTTVSPLPIARPTPPALFVPAAPPTPTPEPTPTPGLIPAPQATPGMAPGAAPLPLPTATPAPGTPTAAPATTPTTQPPTPMPGATPAAFPPEDGGAITQWWWLLLLLLPIALIIYLLRRGRQQRRGW